MQAEDLGATTGAATGPAHQAVDYGHITCCLGNRFMGFWNLEVPRAKTGSLLLCVLS